MWSDNETTTDFLGFQHLSNAVLSIISKDHLLPATIGVYGDWGSGKSSLIQMVEAKLKEKEKEGVVVLTFNGWLFEGYEDAKTALMGSILEELIDQKKILPEMVGAAKKLLGRVDKLKVVGGLGKLGLAAATGVLPLLLSGGFDILSALKSAGSVAKGKIEGANVEDITSFIKEKDEADAEQNLRRSIRKFREDFAQLLKDSKIKTLVVIVDDLDRCLPDSIIETLEAIKLFLFVEHTAFILGADERLVKYAVRKRFPELPGERVEVGRDYLEKLVQFPVRVPPLGRPEMETYISLLFADLKESGLDAKQREQARTVALTSCPDSLTSVNFNLSIAQRLFNDKLPKALSEQLALAQRIGPLLGASMKGNPRQCKRFLNTLLMRLEMAESRTIKLDQRVLAKLMLLEYFKPESFRRLAELQADQTGTPAQLAQMETIASRGTTGVQVAKSEVETAQAIADVKKPKKQNGKTESPIDTIQTELDGEFKTWISQKWTNDWLQLEPSLAGMDLRPYFYFSRDTLGPMGGDAQRMSPLAQEILVDLLKDAQTYQTTALKKSADLSVSEAVSIFEGLSQRAQQEDELDTNNRPLMRLFDLTEVRKELRGELVNLLRRLPESTMSSALVPKILQLTDGHDSSDAGLQLLRKWAESTNKGLAEAARTRLDRRK